MIGWSSVLVGAAVDRPNVLLILVDDLKPAMGCYGDELAITPNMDGLAARGTRFELAYCNQAVCASSRFALMLGAHSTTTGLYGLGSRLRGLLLEAVTLPQVFERAGCRTESLGKIFHIGHGNEGDPASFSVPHFKEKVIEYLDPAELELYDYETDPLESRNVAAENPKAVERLRGILARHPEAVGRNGKPVKN